MSAVCLQYQTQIGLTKYSQKCLVSILNLAEYLGTVQDIHLNGDYCAVRFDGKLQLHVIEGEGHEAGDVSEDRESIMFPESTSRNDVISCHALTPDFLIFGTDMGSLHFFFLEDWALVHEFRHNAGIKYVVPEPNGTKVSTKSHCVEIS